MMKMKIKMGMNNKVKIIILAIAFVLFAVGMNLFGFAVMGNNNEDLSNAISERNVELEVLQREQKSFEQGKIDLAILEKSDFPPEELFSRDTKVVKEIQQLESAAQLYGLELTISVSGSVKDAKPLPGTNSGLFVIPYTITLEGNPNNILMFIQASERMSFITHIKGLNMSVRTEDMTTAVIRSEFYIKK